MEEDMKAKQAELEASKAKGYAERERKKADMKAFNETMERLEPQRKADREMETRLEAFHDKTDAR
jgi:hypothetical protein